MTFFTKSEFETKYNKTLQTSDEWKIEAVCDMIFSQVGLRYRDNTWDENTAPTPIKMASMEQLRFLLEYDMPLLDNRGSIKAGNMESNLRTDYSTLALRILANSGYLYRGNPINQNMGLNIPF
jgi:hypothetical protein